MNVPREIRPLVRRFARWLLAGAVRHWPEETRAWGLAAAAELDETTDAWESLAWSLGGIRLFLRSLAGSAWAWLRLPVGVSPSGVTSSLLPKRSRLLTLTTLGAAAVLLSLPQGREALNTYRSSWSGFVPSGFDGWQLDRLGRRAEKQNDASMLAFLALSTDDPGRFLGWADRAVSIDPEYVWIYADGAARTGWPQYAPEFAKRLERLEGSEPDNAAPALLEASLLANTRISELYERHSPRPAEVQATLEADPKWMALMQRAFAAPRYDTYLGRYAQLASAVWSREKNLSPSTVLAVLLGRPVPSLNTARVFSATVLHQSEESAMAGDFLEAQRLIGQVSGFGERLAGGQGTSRNAGIENLIGLMLERDAAAELRKLYTSAGRLSDAQRAASETAQIDDRLSELHRRLEASGFARMYAFRRLGFLLQVLGILLLLGTLATSLALVVLEIVPARFTDRRLWLRTPAARAADCAPTALVILSGAFLLSFLPYARVFAQCRSSPMPLAGEHLLVEALAGLGAIPVRVLSSNYEGLFWFAVTIALSGLAMLIVARSLYRSRRVRALDRP